MSEGNGRGLELTSSGTFSALTGFEQLLSVTKEDERAEVGGVARPWLDGVPAAEYTSWS
jgi:hypothetical protein